MIRYPRRGQTVPRPPVPLRGGKKGSARKEREHNAPHLASGDKDKLKFGLYKHGDVRDALHQLFGRKCVFCESSLLGTQPGDIEHYRPKGEASVLDPASGKHLPVSAGYPWLAASWSNLLLSCADCNRPRRQVDGAGMIRVMGKACLFPLADEKARAATPWAVRREAALLLNPRRDDPDLHLAFTDEGGITARPGAGGASPRGAATIACCGLDRAELVEMRLRHAKTVQAAIRHIILALEQGQEPDDDLDDLLALLDPHSSYVAFTRHLVRTHLSPYLDKLGLAP